MASALFGTTACSDFLDETPKGKLTPGTYYSTQDELNMSINALLTQVTSSQQYTNMQYPQWQGDDITANPGSNKQACAQLDAFAATADNKGVRDAWNQHYSIIDIANSIIDNAGRTPTSKTEIDIALGQAYFWRAYAYFYLVRLYGPLPMNLHNTSDGGKTPLTSVEGVYQQIVSDLLAADACHLPTTYKGQPEPRFLFNQNVYVSAQVVKSTLAAVYMAMAGYPLQKTELYAKAAEAAGEVVKGAENGTFDLRMDADWKQVYSMGNNYNNETVLGVNYSPIVSWNLDSQLSSTNYFESLGGWGDTYGEIDFWVRMPEGPRKDAVYEPQIRDTEGNLHNWWDTTDGQPIQKDKKNAAIAEYHPMFCIFTVNADNSGKAVAAPFDYKKPRWGGMCNDHRHRLIRYPEVMLWYAESLARSGGDLATVKKYLKLVRSRAVKASEVNKVNGVDIDAMNADQLAQACYEEHGWEVAGYYPALVTRRADQLRMNDLKNTFARRVANAPITVAPGFSAQEDVAVKGTWSDAMNYIPYPIGDAEKNPNLK